MFPYICFTVTVNLQRKEVTAGLAFNLKFIRSFVNTQFAAVLKHVTLPNGIEKRSTFNWNKNSTFYS